MSRAALCVVVARRRSCRSRRRHRLRCGAAGGSRASHPCGCAPARVHVRVCVCLRACVRARCVHARGRVCVRACVRRVAGQAEEEEGRPEVALVFPCRGGIRGRLRRGAEAAVPGNLLGACCCCCWLLLRVVVARGSLSAVRFRCCVRHARRARPDATTCLLG
jgi:hypothetical protein